MSPLIDSHQPIPHSASQTACPLKSCAAGRFVCKSVGADGSDAIALKRLGIAEGRSLRVLKRGNPMVLEVAGARIGLSPLLADMVFVDAIADS